MKKNLFFILSFILILLFSCRSNRIDRVLEYQPNCINCGNTPDGILEIDMIKKVTGDSLVFITIKNLSDETIILDDKLFSGTQDGKLVMFPIGVYNPYLRFSYNYLSQMSETRPTYNYLLGYIGESKQELGRSTIYEYEPKTPLPIPPQTTLIYYVINYPLSLTNERITLERKKAYNIYNPFNWKKVDVFVSRMAESVFGFNIIYRKINETNWRSFELLYKPIKIEIVEKKIPN